MAAQHTVQIDNKGQKDSIFIDWFNTHFHFGPGGQLVISGPEYRIIFEGNELDLLRRLEGLP